MAVVNFIRSKTKAEIEALTTSIEGGVYFASDYPYIYLGTGGAASKYSGLTIVASRPTTPVESQIYMIGSGGSYAMEVYTDGAWVTLVSSLTLGETSSTAYRGDRGKVAYDHSLVETGNPHNVTAEDVNAQPLDADLTAIAALTGTSGLLKKTDADTWALDTDVYLTEITKALVEAVLTGLITSHTHNYTNNDGTVTSVAISLPTGLTASGSPITSVGTLAVSFQTGYSIPTEVKQALWDAAYTHSQVVTGQVHGMWSKAGNDLNYSDGKVAIGDTGILSSYNLLVQSLSTEDVSLILYRLGKTVWTLGSDDLKFKITSGSSSDKIIYFDNTGTGAIMVGIGKDTPTTALDVDGVVTATSGNSTQWNTGYDHSQLITGQVHGMWTKTVNDISYTGGFVSMPTAKLTTGASAGKSWVCTNADGSGSWQDVSGAVYKGEVDGDNGIPLAGGSALIDGTGTAGWYYACSDAGTYDYGNPSGNSIILAIGDQIYYNGTSWLKIPGAGSYTLPLATTTSLGGFKIGYSNTGSNIAVAFSSEKAYVALTKAAIENALTAATASSNGYATSTQIDKLDKIEAEADVTDEDNVSDVIKNATTTTNIDKNLDFIPFLDDTGLPGIYNFKKINPVSLVSKALIENNLTGTISSHNHLDAYVALTPSSNITVSLANASGNKTLTTAISTTLTFTNVSGMSGLSGDIRVNATAISTITLAGSGITISGKGSLVLPIGVHHIAFTVISDTIIDYNVGGVYE